MTTALQATPGRQRGASSLVSRDPLPVPDPPAHGSDLGPLGVGVRDWTSTGVEWGTGTCRDLWPIDSQPPSPSSASHPTTPTEFLVYKIVPPAPTATLWGLRNPGTHSPYRGKEGRVRAGRGLRREGVGRGKWQRTGRGSRLYFLFFVIQKSSWVLKGQSLC